MLRVQLIMKKIITNQYFWLLLIVILGLALRLYKIQSPIADWHSWRQADTAAVTRNFIKEGFNPLYPKYDDMSGVAEKPIPNPNRFRFVEFPIYNIFVYPFYLFFGVHEVYHRLVSVIFSLGSIIFLYFISKKYFGITIGLLSAFCFTALPFNVFFSRTVLPEPTFVFFALGMMYFADQWIETRGRTSLIWTSLFIAAAFLMKPWAIFFVPPLIYSSLKMSKKVFRRYVAIFILAVIPFILWRLWIGVHPEGIPASNWLLNGDGIRFRPAFWWWIISQRLGGEILGVTGLVLFTIGLIIRPRSGNYFLHIWALSLFSYFAIFATGNVRHNYYQTIFMPVVSVFLAAGFVYLVRGVNAFLPRIWTIILALIFFPLTFYFTWMPVKEFYKINNPNIIEAGQEADKILPKEAVVLAPYNGDTAFLYHTNRSGWPVTALPIPQLVSDFGVTNYISTSHDDKTNWVMRHFKVLKDNNKFTIADLTKIIHHLTKEDPEP